ncbi:glycoside hydrolase family 30 protein [Fulvivirga ligni]|uniref:glycoside hydrolase family 30 protein n=1 Tax=Fulvivirga ligni TaxID=2904246 RepID=UPI001F313C9F|nr:glycoside hydrolase family 30 beta sandwich domain-containing protein [Fulvivirga ligni]UII20648.1 glucosylceramidase [Fulvivirga ligni]
MRVKGVFALISAGLLTLACSGKKEAQEIQVLPLKAMITTGDQSKLLLEQEVVHIDTATDVSNAVIEINPEQKYQEIDGFGYTLTGGSAMHIHQMDSSSRHQLLQNLFSTDGESIGVSYLRLSVGASDLDAEPFSYDDLADGEEDVELKKFTLERDQEHLIPVLKEILSINPDIQILGSPWSPPKWMKDNKDTRGGSLLPKFYDAYSHYLVKYIQGMEAEGITIHALTIQNEPLHPGNNPSLLMKADQQAEFIKTSLGPVFQDAGIKTKIIVYDHNADRPDYPATIYQDEEAAKYVDGAAFHLYGGTIDTLKSLHDQYPDKNLYFTEQWIGAPGNFPQDIKWHTKELIIGATRNWCKTVLEWNLAADPDQNPHTDRGGCDRCLGAVTIDGNEVIRNPAYYIIAHASKYVRPGSVRVESNMIDGLPNVAFKTPAGEIINIVLNEGSDDQVFTMRIKDKEITTKLQPGAVATYIYQL